MFKWVYDATIYRKVDGAVLLNRRFETRQVAEAFIEQNIKKFANDKYPPTGHVNKDYVLVDKKVNKK